MKHLKLFLAIVAVAFFGAAVGMFALSFVDSQAVVLVKSDFAKFLTGFDILFKQNNGEYLESNNTLGAWFALVFVALGLLAAIYAVVVAAKQKKGKKGNKTAKLACACCTFVVCGIVPAVLLFLTLQTAGISADSTIKGFVGANFKLGVGAILSAVFSLLGACSLSVAELK